MNKEVKRLFLWSGPRNISTTLMYSFAQRADTQVYDEPLYGYYLKNTSASEYHPGAQEIMDAMQCDGEQVVKMMLGPHPKPIAFFKNMTHHLLDLDREFLKRGVNLLLTRHPREMLPSFHRVIPHPSMKDVGYQAHVELVHHFLSHSIPFVVIESSEILKNPAERLKGLCQHLAIPFDEAMLSWPKGARQEDGPWARHWYSAIHQSTGYKPYQPDERPFPQELKALYDECLPLYQSLLQYAL